MELYQNIRNRRQELGMTQDELAKKTGYCDKSAIAKIEAGKVDLPQSKIMKFAECLEISASDLMGWDDGYYHNDDTALAAEEIFHSPELRMLFDAAKDADPEDLKTVHAMLLALKRKG